MSGVPSLLSRLRGPKPAISTHVFSSDPAVTEMLAATGWDFAKVDLEHTTLGISDALAHIRAGAGAGIPVVVRVSQDDSATIAKLLDAGAAGIVLPHFGEDREASIRAALTVRYPPTGTRPTCTGTRAAGFGRGDFPAYVAEADRELLSIALVEDVRAIDGLEETLKRAHVNAVEPGPGDLASSLGVPGQFDHPRVVEAVAAILDAGRKAGIARGIYVRYPEDYERWRSHAPEFIMCSIDYRILANSFASLAQALRK